MDKLTSELNERSIENVRNQIRMKTSEYPYFANGKTAMNSVTDFDHHPYTRWFRGVYYHPEPIIAEREAGWRPLSQDCYDFNPPPVEEKEVEHCFEIPCSTTLPCYPKYLTKYADKEALDLMINKTCVIGYR